MIGKSIHNILSTDAPVLAIVSDRIYPHRMNQNDPMPAISYEVINILPTDEKDGVSRLDIDMVDIDLFSKSYEDLIDLATKARTALDGFIGTDSGNIIERIRFVFQQESFDEEVKIYQITQQYKIRLK